MDFLLIGLVAFLASGLTLYSGFGLGTVLLPAFALFFPVEVAVAATGTVHLLNNLFKGGCSAGTPTGERSRCLACLRSLPPWRAPGCWSSWATRRACSCGLRLGESSVRPRQAS